MGAGGHAEPTLVILSEAKGLLGAHPWARQRFLAPLGMTDFSGSGLSVDAVGTTPAPVVLSSEATENLSFQRPPEPQMARLFAPAGFAQSSMAVGATPRRTPHRDSTTERSVVSRVPPVWGHIAAAGLQDRRRRC